MHPTPHIDSDEADERSNAPWREQLRSSMRTVGSWDDRWDGSFAAIEAFCTRLDDRFGVDRVVPPQRTGEHVSVYLSDGLVGRIAAYVYKNHIDVDPQLITMGVEVHHVRGSGWGQQWLPGDSLVSRPRTSTPERSAESLLGSTHGRGRRVSTR